MAYVGNQPVPQATQTRDRFVATSGQTSFATSGYTPQFIDVYLDGVKLDTSEFTATNGSDVVLNAGATTGQILEVVAFSSFDVADIRNMTQPLGLKNYTTTERNALTNIGAGDTIFNSTIGSIEFYDGTNWIATNLIPVISSISGTIYSGAATTLTLSVSSTTETVDVKYYEGSTLLATDSGVTVASGSCTSTVPSAVYGQSAGDTILIQVFNLDGTPSNSVSKTVVGTPTGGTITTYSNYRVHTFTSSGNLTVPSGFTATSDVLLVAGGGGGGYIHGGGGGAGGMLTATKSLSAGTLSVVVGAGGSGNGSSGSNSSFSGTTAIGGGYGESRDVANAGSGGSGGGGAGTGGPATHLPGSGTSGQGNAGGQGLGAYGTASSTNAEGGGGGGGKGAAGSQGTTSAGGNGGIGATNNYRTGSNVYYAGGGGGGSTQTSGSFAAGSGGNGGGGAGGPGASNATSGTSNTGGGGGGSGYNATSGTPGAGGSGIVVIRYQLS